MNENIKKIILNAYNRILVEDNWTKQAMARATNGGKIGPQMKDAVKWCMRGAIMEEGYTESINITLATAELRRDVYDLNLTTFNDNSSHSQVLTTFRKTMDRLEISY